MVAHKGCRYKDGNHHELAELYNRLCMASDQLTPLTVMKILVQTLGGSRIYIPTLKYLERIERNKRIRQEFHGGNYRELAARFGLTVMTIRVIVHSERSRKVWISH